MLLAYNQPQECIVFLRHHTHAYWMAKCKGQATNLERGLQIKEEREDQRVHEGLEQPSRRIQKPVEKAERDTEPGTRLKLLETPFGNKSTMKTDNLLLCFVLSDSTPETKSRPCQK